MEESDARGLTEAQEAHRIPIHQHDFLQVQRDPGSVASHLRLQYLEVFRLNSATQVKDRVVPVGAPFDS